jgi:predicted RNase H-like HicB family nuclease
MFAFSDTCEIGRKELMRYAIVIEKGPTSYGAYVPDLPGCIAFGQSSDEVRRLIAEVIEFHLEGLRLHGDAIPQPSSLAEYVDAVAPTP